MKKFIFILIGMLGLAPCSFSQGTFVYCYNDPVRSPYYFAYSIKADGTDNKQVISANVGLNHFEWSPDGKKIACVGYQNIETSWSIYVFDADGTHLNRLTSLAGVLDGALSWSADGTRIAFTRSYTDEPTRAHEVWIMKADGTDQKFSGIYGFQPMWSPDGKKFVYCSLKSGNWEIYVSDIDGRNEQRLTSEPSTDLNPVWSPDGTLIAFMSERVGNPEIFVMQADGTRPVRLTMNSGYEGMPRWSPDGNQIAFNSGSTGAQTCEVFIINTDGNELTRITNSTGGSRSINPAWYPVQSSGIPGDTGLTLDRGTLGQNYPNPFTTSTTIDFAVVKNGLVRLAVTDLSGRTVTRLAEEFMNPGIYSVIWNPVNSTGNVLDPGIYLYCLEGEGFKIWKKAVLTGRD